jgi:catalase
MSYDDVSKEKGNQGNKKTEQLEEFRVQNAGNPLTTSAGLKVSNNDAMLKAGTRGPALMQDFLFLDKLMHFDRERTPERVAHARGFGVHGNFQVYQSMKPYTKAGFLQNPSAITPVFVRFSTNHGGRGSIDTSRDLRGFAVKFYTDEGNFDLLSVNLPIFFVNDAQKFVDSHHAANPNPRTDMPTASAAQDNFWDFVANNQESAHFVMWLMSDRTVPRSWRMMEGFGVNAFRFINDQGTSRFVRFQWRPVLGVHSFLQEESLIIGGLDPDFHRRDIYEAIQRGVYPEYEFGVQMIEEEKEYAYDFDVLDPTKLWPEEIVPVHIIGKLTLNRNVDNFFAETEQSVFDPTNVVPGIGFSNDPILQGRLIAYRDTQMYRLGGPNINEIPINRPLCPFHNYQREGAHRERIDIDQVNYYQNSLAGNTPSPTPVEQGGFEFYPEKIKGLAIKAISDTFKDYFSQARLFWNSLSDVERDHILQSFSFQLAKVKSESVRQQVVDMFGQVDHKLASTIASNIGVRPPSTKQVSVSASSPALSQANTPHFPNTMRVGVLIGNGFLDQEVISVVNTLVEHGVFVEFLSDRLGTVTGAQGTTITLDQNFHATNHVLYDSLYVVGGRVQNQAAFDWYVKDSIQGTYKYYKPIGVATTGEAYMQPPKNGELEGVVFASSTNNFGEAFVRAIAMQRFWNRK